MSEQPNKVALIFENDLERVAYLQNHGRELDDETQTFVVNDVSVSEINNVLKNQTDLSEVVIAFSRDKHSQTVAADFYFEGKESTFKIKNQVPAMANSWSTQSEGLGVDNISWARTYENNFWDRIDDINAGLVEKEIYEVNNQELTVYTNQSQEHEFVIGEIYDALGLQQLDDVRKNQTVSQSDVESLLYLERKNPNSPGIKEWIDTSFGSIKSNLENVNAPTLEQNIEKSPTI